MDVSAFITQQKTLLQLERDEEIAQEKMLLEGGSLTQKQLEAKGHLLSRLFVSDMDMGLYGRMLVSLRRFKGESNIADSSSFRMKDIVGLRTNNDSVNEDLKELSGIVHSVKQECIVVAFEHFPAELHKLKNLRLVRLGNDVTFTRHMKTLEQLTSVMENKVYHETDVPSVKVMDVIFQREEPAFTSNNVKAEAVEEMKQYPEYTLNSTQVHAVSQAMRSHDLHLIHGPPGTGKTTTVIDLIRRSVARGDRVLACAPSNIAVDNMAERLDQLGVNCVRIGHPARLIESVLHNSLDHKLRTSDNAKIVNDIRKEMMVLVRKLGRAASSLEKREYRNELKFLKKEIRTRERLAVAEVLDAAQVVLCTCNGVHSRSLFKRVFDLVVIDEAAQGLEVECLGALLKGKRGVLAGDHCQLPPTILSDQASAQGLLVTLFDRCIQTLPAAAVSMLTIQYRMHNMIMQWSSREFYENKLTADDSVVDHVLNEIDGVKDTEDTCFPFVVIDTAGYGLSEDEPTVEHESTSNSGEASLIATHVEELVAAGLKPSDIAVITPYKAQMALLKHLLQDSYAGLEIGTVDGFQGREKEAVLISTVRSNDDREVGFLRESRRMNVAVTRARRHVCIVMDSTTLSSDPFLKRLVTYSVDNADYRAPDSNQKTEEEFRPFLEDRTTVVHAPVVDRAETKQEMSKKGPKQQRKVRVIRENENDSVKQTGEDLIQVVLDETTVDVKMTSEGIDVFLDQVVELGKSKQDIVVNFPSSVNAYQRMLVHGEADKKPTLVHTSEGQGKQRVLKISIAAPLSEQKVEKKKKKKKKKKSPVVAIVNPTDELPPTNPAVNQFETFVKTSPAVVEEVSVKAHAPKPAANNLLAEAAKERAKRSAAADARARANNIEKKKKAKAKKSKQMQNKTEAELDDDEFESMLKEFRVDQCKFDKCKVKVKNSGFTCQYCNERFCVEHMNPIFHGCGAERKADKQRQAAAAMKGNPHQMTTQKKTLLQKKLREKTQARNKPLNTRKKR